MDPGISCSHCQRRQAISEFPTNRLGHPYKTCNGCRTSRRANRVPLGELDPNAPLQMRSGRQRSVSVLADDHPRLGRRQRSVSILADDNTRPRRRARHGDGLTADQRAAQRTREREEALINSPSGFLSQLRIGARPYDLGNMDHECEYCGAFHFIDEQGPDKLFEGCCKRGDAVLERLRTPPDALRMLYEGQTVAGRAFRQNIRSYNNSLAFTSCFRIHGELFHYQGPLIPGSQELPCFAQLFFYDPDYATDVRISRHSNLNPEVLRQLTDMLTDCNPFITLYRTARERLTDHPMSQNRLLLNPQMRLVIEQGADRRRENLPTSNEIAVIIPDEFEEASRRDIVLAVRNPERDGPQLSRIHVTHAAYMPLHYVLLFPHGDLGWHYTLELRQGQRTRQRIRLEQRVYYRFRLHIRKDEFPTLFLAGRLLQQYIVDAFVVYETTALE